MAGKQRPKGEGTAPYQLGENRWRAQFMDGYHPDGRRRFKRVYGRTEAECARRLRKALTERDQGTLTAGRSPRLVDWLDHWLENIAAQRLRPRTLNTYRGQINTWVRGARTAGIRLDKLAPEDLEALYGRMRAAGRSETTITHMHRVLSRALTVAVQRRRIPVNPATRMDAPRPAKYTPTVLDTGQVRALITVARNDPQAARWLFGLALGPRQGEVLGLAWPDVDLGAGTATIRREVYRLPWAHGCSPGGDPACGRAYAPSCPKRTGGGLFTGPPKSEAGQRVLPVPPQLLPTLRTHHAARPPGRLLWASGNGEELDLVFARPDGRPLDARADWGAWKDLCARAGVPAVRVHDARHVAATTMLLLGVPGRVVMEVMGWSQAAMLQRYQHVMEEATTDAAARIGATLLTGEGGGPGGKAPPPSNVVSLDAARRARHA